MENETLKLEGWKHKYMKDIDFFQCPYCGFDSESIHPNEEGTRRCPKCNTRYHYKEMKLVTKKKPVVTCKICGQEVSLTPENIDFIGGFSYVCPSCGNHVAIEFKNHILQPSTVMSIGWNKKIIERSKKLNKELLFALCETEKDFLILKIMQLMAKKEQTGFFYVRKEEQRAGIVFDPEQGKYMGFIVGTEKEKAILRQIYITKEERFKGHGTKLLRFWVKNFADKINDKFGVESPNGPSQKILVKLGYAKIEGEYIKGVKCSFVRE